MKHHHSRRLNAAIACVVFVIGTHMSDLMRLAGSRRFIHGWISLSVANFLQLMLCVSGVMIAHATGIKRAIGELGLRAPIGRAATFAVVAALPMLLVFALSSPLNPKMSILSVGVGCVLAPFAEEVLFRGYMFGQLYRRARWGFWLSALIPSVLFALGHAYQASGVSELLGIFAVTGLGSILGCWLFMRWQCNLWVVFGLHGLMNLWWEVFGVDDTALGGWIANGARLVTVIVAILLTICKDRIWKPLIVAPDHLAESDDETSKQNRAETRVHDAPEGLLIWQPAH
jgi:membrane protease YdiL (CAAX protease family)